MVKFDYWYSVFVNSNPCLFDGFYRDIQPPHLNEDVVVTNNKSESGVFLGRSLVRTGAKQQTINIDSLSHNWIYNTWLPFKKSAELNPFIYSFGNTPLFNNQLCYQTAFAPVKLKDRIGTGHGSVGVTFEEGLMFVYRIENGKFQVGELNGEDFILFKEVGSREEARNLALEKNGIILEEVILEEDG